MHLENIQAEIRHRTPWEAIDLGFLMVRAWWISIYTPLVLVMLALALTLTLLLPDDSHWVVILIIWWLKPLYHRLILHVISHQMFGESLSIGASLRALPDLMLRTGLFGELTWRRLSLSRGVRLPVYQLERLRGASLKSRLSVLIEWVQAPTISLTVAVFFFQLILAAAFLILLMMFIPQQYTESFFDSLLRSDSGTTGWAVEYLTTLLIVSIIAFLEPYFIASSFAIYLNQRTQLEAWDIELDFRKLSHRLEGLQHKLNIGFAALLLTFLFSGGSQTSAANALESAEEDNYTEQLADTRLSADAADRIIKQVMQHKDLSQEEVGKSWQLKDDEEIKPVEANEPSELARFIGGIFATLFEFALWIILSIAVITLYVYRHSWLPQLTPTIEQAQDARPDILFGMDVREESLPHDIVSSARQLWLQGQRRDALSILYRGALARLMTQDALPLKDSHTEGDILKLSRQALDDRRQSYLHQLTKSWVKVAYAHDQPSDIEMEYLLDHWNDDFAIMLETDSS